MHKPYFTEITIPRPADLAGSPWTLKALTNVVAVFGKNGSGKSRLLRAWRDIDLTKAHYVVPERTGALDYQANYLAVQIDPQQRRNNSVGNFVGEYRRHIVARIQAYFTARGDFRGNGLPGHPEELESFISSLLPDFAVELSGTKNPPYIFKRILNNSTFTDVEQLSSGEAQLLIMALDILTIAAIWDIQGAETRAMLIDEPDAHIHPDLMVRFADFIVRVTERFKLQTVIATHSTTLLAALGHFGSSEASVIYLDRMGSEFKAEPFNSVMRELAACLGGHALMGPLFGVPLLLVEGDDDYRIWSQVPRHHVVNFSVIPTGGEEIKKYQRSLDRIFSALREDGSPLSGYALLDNDKPKPQINAENPQKHIRFVQLACHESENLYLSDEVLTLLGTNWAIASAKLIAEANAYGAKAAKLKTAMGWNRQTEDIKDVIEQIATILDPKRVHWTIRIAKVLGGARPIGQIAQFVGGEVVNALWGAPTE